MIKKLAENNSGKGIAQTVLDDLQVTVEALLGVARITVGELSQLSPGDNFTLDRQLGDAVELRLNGVTVAFGELVTVGDNFGVRIQKIASV